MELFELLEWVARLFTVAVAAYAVLSFNRRQFGILLGTSILLIASYNVFPLGGEEHAGAWIHHIPLYIGMLLFAYFLNSFARAPETQEREDRPNRMLAVAGTAGTMMASDASQQKWFEILTREGLQHIIVLPLFAGILISVLVRSAEAGRAFHRPMKWFLLAGGAATMVHVMEFIVESQKFFLSLRETGVETLELILVFTTLTCFTIAIRSARALRKAQA